MGIFETIGVLWTVFATSLATVATLWLAYTGLKTVLRGQVSDRIGEWARQL